MPLQFVKVTQNRTNSRPRETYLICSLRQGRVYTMCLTRHEHMAGATYLVSKDDLEAGRSAEDGIPYVWEVGGRTGCVQAVCRR